MIKIQLFELKMLYLHFSWIRSKFHAGKLLQHPVKIFAHGIQTGPFRNKIENHDSILIFYHGEGWDWLAILIVYIL